MKRAFALSVSVFAATWATNALADVDQLRGSYAFTGTAGCLVTLGNPGVSGNPSFPPVGPGFDSANRPLDFNYPNGGNSFARSFSVEGVRTFNGNGTGTVRGTLESITVRPAPIAPNANSSDFQYQFTYTVDGEDSWTSQMVPGSYLETITSGPRAGQFATEDAIPEFAGTISSDRKTLTAAHLKPTPETRSFLDAPHGNVLVVNIEICHRSRVFLHLQSDHHDHDRDHR